MIESCHTEIWIMSILTKAESGGSVSGLCRTATLLGKLIEQDNNCMSLTYL
jgi:hypothetical protein